MSTASIARDNNRQLIFAVPQKPEHEDTQRLLTARGTVIQLPGLLRKIQCDIEMGVAGLKDFLP